MINFSGLRHLSFFSLFFVSFLLFLYFLSLLSFFAFLLFSYVVLCIFRPLPNKTLLKFDQYFKACWSFCFETKSLNESEYSGPLCRVSTRILSKQVPFPLALGIMVEMYIFNVKDQYLSDIDITFSYLFIWTLWFGEYVRN